jgi:hypothetical protein
MSFIDIKHGAVVVVRSGQLSPMLFIGQVMAPPTEKTAMIAFWNSSSGEFGRPSRKDRNGIIGILRTDMTPKSGVEAAAELIAARNAAIREANLEFEAGLLDLVEKA